MRAKRSLEAGVGCGGASIPLPAIAGPLLGLAYIIVLPFVGIATCILAGGYYVTRNLEMVWHRVTQAVVMALRK